MRGEPGVSDRAGQFGNAGVLVLVDANEECLERHVRPIFTTISLSLYVGSVLTCASINLCLTLRRASSGAQPIRFNCIRVP